MKKYDGKCSCGKLEYSFEDEPINTAFCYCSECQTHTGSDKYFGLWVPFNKLRFTKGTPSTFTRIGDSGEDLNHKFCSDCGTTVCVEATVANIYSVAASTVTTANDFSPKMSIYAASAPEWAVFPEGIPKFDVLPPEINI